MSLLHRQHDHLRREFKPTESNFPYIVPALENGLTVRVTEKIAKEFAIADPGFFVKGTMKHIKFVKIHLGLVLMTLEE